MGALGYTLQMPLEDRYLLTKSEIIGKIKGLLGGRAAEEMYLMKCQPELPMTLNALPNW
jgi:ATP-dependent Zn protease